MIRFVITKQINNSCFKNILQYFFYFSYINYLQQNILINFYLTYATNILGL